MTTTGSTKVWTVVATADRPDWMRRQIQAVLPQLAPDEKMVVVFDGDQASANVLTPDFKADSRLHFVTLLERRGPDTARRIGNALVPPSAVILEVDDHDIVTPDCLEEVRRAFDAEDIVAAYSDVYHTEV